MFTKYDFSLKEDVKSYLLQQTAFKLKSTDFTLDILNGGHVNHVWKIQSDTTAFIIKQVPPFARYKPEVALPQERALLEYKALQLAFNTSTLWNVPEPFAFDETHYVIFMDYVPGITLLEYLKTSDGPKKETEWIAETIVSFINTVSKLQPDDCFKGTKIGHHIEHVAYGDFQTQAKLYSIPNYKEWDERSTLNYTLRDNGFIFGDLWPNSILVDERTKKLYFIDWECARVGKKEMDFTQLIANLFIMTHGDFRKQETEELIQKMVLVFEKGDTFDYEASFVRFVTFLVPYSHWGLRDREDVVHRSLDFSFNKPK